MKRHTFHIILLLLTLCLISGCRENRQVAMLLSHADSLMDLNPDSALRILEDAREEVASCPRAQRMRHELLVAKAQNKAYVDFTTDSVMLLVSDYYDHHGTPNDRMMAHYLLGCCYRDMGEAPHTLECYKEAVECADTLSPDCDFRTMMSIFGQMSTLYENQVMPVEELEVLEKYGKYAKKCADSLACIQSIVLQLHAYNLLNDTTQIYKLTREAQRRYLEIGEVERSAQALSIAIRNRLSNNQIQEAKSLMDEFEAHSGLFNEKGEINDNWANYYISKGLYYQAVSRPDSAEYFYKLLLDIRIERDAYKGLLRLYSDRGQTDSVSKYLNLFEDVENIFITDINFQSVRQTEAMYDYSRNQRIAMQKNAELERTRLWIAWIVFAVLTLLVVIYLYIRRQRAKRQMEIEKLTTEYVAITVQYEKSKQDLEDATNRFVSFESQKREELEELEQRLNVFEEKFQKMNTNDKKIALCGSPVVRQIREMTKPSHTVSHPTNRHWKELAEIMQQTSPKVYQTIVYSSLSETEQRIALLTRLEFSVCDIALLLDTTPQSISNAKRKANKKLFNMDNSKTFSNNIMQL